MKKVDVTYNLKLKLDPRKQKETHDLVMTAFGHIKKIIKEQSPDISVNWSKDLIIS